MSAADNKDIIGLELSEADPDSDETEVTAAVESVSEDKQWIGVSDLAIGGRCKCNGHAAECTLDKATGQ